MRADHTNCIRKISSLSCIQAGVFATRFCLILWCIYNCLFGTFITARTSLKQDKENKSVVETGALLTFFVLTKATFNVCGAHTHTYAHNNIKKISV